MRVVFEAIPTWLRLLLLLGSAAASLWLIGTHRSALEPAVDDSDYGIVAFEFAGSPDEAEKILDDWNEDGREAARDAIRIDYGFLVAYTVLLALACGSLALILDGWAWGWFESLGWWLAGLMPLAGLLDAVENTALLRVLDGYESGSISGTATRLAAGAAAVKFAIAIAAGLYVLSALVALGKRAIFD